MTMLAFLKSAIIPKLITVSPETTVAEVLKQIDAFAPEHNGVIETTEIETAQTDTAQTDTAQTDTAQTDTAQPDSWYTEICARCIVVLAQGQVAGIVTEQEIGPFHQQQWRSPHNIDPVDTASPSAINLLQHLQKEFPLALAHSPVRNIMVPPAATLRSSACHDIPALMTLLQQPGIRYLPVIGDANEFIGIISRESLGYAALQQMVRQQDGTTPLPSGEPLKSGGHGSSSPRPNHLSAANVTERPETNRPETNRPETNRPETNRPETNRPETNRPETDPLATDPLATDRPETDRPVDSSTLELEQEFAARITELEAKVNWEKVLVDLTAQICASLDLQTILDVTVEQVQPLLGCDRVTIWQFEAEGRAIAVAEAAAQNSVTLLGERIDTTTLDLDQQAPPPNIHTTQFSDYYPDTLVRLQSRDKLLVPLFCGDKLWGLLQVNGPSEHHLWPAKDVELLQFLSMQLAIALQHATTHQQLQKELEERRQVQLHQQKTALALQQLNQTLETKVAERTLALQEREHRYRALIEVMPDLMLRIHADGTYLDVVPGQRSPSFNLDNVRPGVNIYAVASAEQARTRMAYVHQALATKTVQFYEYERIVDGNPLVEEARIIAINASEALVIVREITERKYTENQLRESEQRFRRAIANAPFPIMIHAEDGEMLQVNDIWTEITGYTHRDIPTMQVWAEKAYGDRATEVLETIIQPKYYTDRHTEVELTITTHSGDERIWHFSSTHLGQLADGRRIVMSMAADITQHRHAELALQESEARWQFALEGSGDGVWDWDLQMNTLFFSPQWKAMLGYSDAEIGTGLEEWDDRVHPDDKAQCYTDHDRHFCGDAPIYQNEHRLRCKDGTYKWVLDRGKVVEWSDDGQPLRMIGIHTDISDRKRAEAQLQNLIAGTAAATDQDFFPVLVQHLAEALEITYAIIAELKNSQLHPLAFWGKGHLQPICSYATDQTPCDRSLQDGLYHCECGVQQAFPNDPDLVLLNAESYLGIALYNSQGDTIGNLCILDHQPIRLPQRAKQILRVFAARAAAELERQRARMDLEQLNQALETKVVERTAKLQEREARYRGLMEGAGDGILVCDRHGTVLEVNRKAMELLGYSRDELKGMRFQDLCPPAAGATMVTPFAQLISHPSFHWEDGQFVAKGGCCIPIDISTSVMEIQGKLIIQAIFRDISDRKQAEAILQQTNAELLQATQLKDEFLANMSHELRTPLNAILGMTEGLQDGVFGTLVAKQLEALQTVERSGQHLLQLINDILDVAKIESGHVTLDLTPTAIAPLCRSSLNFVKQQALKKHIQIDTNLPSNLPTLHLDERRIRQVLINLLNNAVKFTPEGGHITLEAHALMGKTQNEEKGTKRQQTADSRHSTLNPQQFSSGDATHFWDAGGYTELNLQSSKPPHSITPNTKPHSPTPPLPHSPTPSHPHSPTPPLPHSPTPSLQISVTDTGIGIAPDHLSRLFQPFVQIDGALNRQFAGTGLGLALVKRIIELHQGTVTVRSEVGVGSCFTITLPCEERVLSGIQADVPKSVGTLTPSSLPPSSLPPSSLPPSNLVPPNLAPSKQPLPTILIVANNEANVRTVSSYLQARGYQVQVARYGKAALTQLQHQPPDLILMDIQMPEMDGLEAIQAVRRDQTMANIPIIALTALALEDDPPTETTLHHRDRYLAAGANEYLSKPVKLRLLASTVQQHLPHGNGRGVNSDE